MKKYDFQTVVTQCEALKAQYAFSVLSDLDLVMIRIAYLNGQQCETAKALKEVA